MAQRIIAPVHKTFVFLCGKLIDDPGFPCPGICCYLFFLGLLVRFLLVFSLFCLLFFFRPFFRIPGDVQDKGFRFFFIRPFLCYRIINRNGQLRGIQTIRCQIILRYIIIYIIFQIQISYDIQVVLYSGRIQRQMLFPLLHEIDILFQIAIGAVLLIDDPFRLFSGKAYSSNFFQFRYFIMFDHIADLYFKLLQRIFFHQVGIAVPDGYIPLGIHGAEIAQLDLIIFLFRFHTDGTYRGVQAILPEIFHFFYYKGNAKLLKQSQ